jgi:hypothetical protein
MDNDTFVGWIQQQKLSLTGQRKLSTGIFKINTFLRQISYITHIILGI